MNFLIRKGGSAYYSFSFSSTVDFLIFSYSLHLLHASPPKKTKTPGGATLWYFNFFYMLIFKNVCCEKGGGCWCYVHDYWKLVLDKILLMNYNKQLLFLGRFGMRCFSYSRNILTFNIWILCHLVCRLFL